MPFTTRPSLTSRQGMIRLASTRQCLLYLNAAFVKRLADDGAVEPRMIDLAQPVQIFNRRHASGSNHAQLGAFQHFSCGIDVVAFEYAVARDVRIDDEAGAD